MELTQKANRYVVVHAGARDGYQVAQALAEDGSLDVLVTDFMWSRESILRRIVESLLPRRMRAALLRRTNAAVPAGKIRNNLSSALKALMLDGAKFVPFSLRQRAARSSDARLGQVASRIATKHRAGLLTYSYYAFHALQSFPRPGVLFQVHPHPMSVRRILEQELADHPDCADSLNQEWELSLPPSDYARLAAEPALAQRILCASSFTRSTLIENGTAESAIRVVPYGVDCSRFRPPPGRRSEQGPLQLLFVGRINQRKGIKYLVEALEKLHSARVHLTICGRVVDDLGVFKRVAGQVTIRPSVGAEELIRAYQSADLFVFPSLVEGFGQVLLEALASGLPLLTTANTAGPDLISEGQEGFIVETRRSDLLADRIEWAATHRRELATMQHQARLQAETFTWARFRSGIAAAAREFSQELYGDDNRDRGQQTNAKAFHMPHDKS